MTDDKSQELRDNCFVSSFSVREKIIEQGVKNCGRLVIAIHNTDWDQKGNFIGDYSELFKRAEKYIQEYNPECLSAEKYKEAYFKGELVWQ